MGTLWRKNNKRLGSLESYNCSKDCKLWARKKTSL